MKQSIQSLIRATFILLSATHLVAQEGSRTEMRDVATHDQLSQKLRMAQQKDPVRALVPAGCKIDSDPSVQTASRDLIKESTILCYRGYLTLIPKEAVLHLPENLKERFVVHPNIKVQSWSEFLQGNRGWIRTIEVSREQAMGLAAIPEETVEAYKLSTSAVIATFNGGPISVLPVKIPETETTGAQAADSKSKTGTKIKS